MGLPGQVEDQAAGVAAGKVVSLMAIRHLPETLIAERGPNLARLDRGFGGGENEDQHGESNESRAQLQGREVRQLHVGDQHAEHEDFHHRPGMHDLDDPEEASQTPHPEAIANRNQHCQGPEHFGQGNEDGDGKYQQGQRPQALVQKLQDAGDQRADLLASFELEGHEGIDVGNREQHEARDTESDGVIDPAVRPAVEASATAWAFGRAALGQGLCAQI